MGEKAVAAAKAVGYVGAGTVEFIFDCDTAQFYFMEMNTRLQVEHPVTEMITRQDLVEWQLEVASGNPLPLRQDQIPLVGHAIEARIYAENPKKYSEIILNSLFMYQAISCLILESCFACKHHPSPKMEVSAWKLVLGKVTGKIDAKVSSHPQGDQVSVYYDPMIAKLVVAAEDRPGAIRRLQTALEQFSVTGLHTNVEFIQRVLSLDQFRTGSLVDTSLIKVLIIPCLINSILLDLFRPTKKSCLPKKSI